MWETTAFVLIGLTVGVGALLLRPDLYPGPRAMPVGTALVAAVLAGRLSGYVLSGHAPVLQLAVSLAASALLVTVPARPDLLPRRRGRHRHG
ncbi:MULTISPECIES: hypothetical protein [Kitasatospora]|uniref:Uncharacterized protein n=1 Tax=Kitasatospora setae (strain ATCC 33774 / DSM 43861 / JCM 3304 / KCC A-0304 / NBRC 14216 / KM-6054) TaxID=452652 RepID=E4NGM3_KITSK|nr:MULTISPECIES: hypothetical protein [Kitasatospora]BAJ30653.1 hypothetical protein KSE_48750 [Kitasatospora setae KM-6054]